MLNIRRVTSGVQSLKSPLRNSGAVEEASMISELQDCMEQMLLPRVFDSIIPTDGWLEKLKRIFENKMDQADVRWGWVVKWVMNIKNRKDPELIGMGRGNNLYLWTEN